MPQQYAISLACQEIEWIKQYATPRPHGDPLMSSASQNSPEHHISLRQKYLKVARFLLPEDPALVAPHIWHTDLYPGNLFVSEGRISCVIYWQGIRAAPLLLRARHPRLVDYKGDIVLKPPANFNDLDSEQKKTLREKMSKSSGMKRGLFQSGNRLQGFPGSLTDFGIGKGYKSPNRSSFFRVISDSVLNFSSE